VKIDDNPPSFNYYDAPDFLHELRLEMQSASLVVGFNLKFDLTWVRRHGIVPPDKTRIWDCQLAEFIISGQTSTYPSLNECLAKYELGSKDDKIAEYWSLGIDTPDIPVTELQFYNDLDVDLTYKLYLKQQEVMTEKQKKLCLIMGLDLLVLAEIEWNGIKFDKELCNVKANETAKKLQTITEELLTHSPTPAINLDSGQHLSCLLYGGKIDIDEPTEEETVYKSGPRKGEVYTRVRHNIVIYECGWRFRPLPKTETKLKKKLALPDGSIQEITIYETNEGVLKQLKKPTKEHRRIIELLLERAELAKLMDTYFGKLPELLDKMGWGEFLHGQYNQVVARTGRLSSSNPNMQNFGNQVDQLLISRYD
jgi:DNA polymerase I-like protein with 3'-5' exonuclease and polymerase domains